MKYRRVGKTGVTVSAIGFGGMRFGKLPDEEAVALLRRALEAGITLFETGNLYGPPYGRSEELFGRAFKDWEKEVHVAIKVVPRERPDGHGATTADGRPAAPRRVAQEASARPGSLLWRMGNGQGCLERLLRQGWSARGHSQGARGGPRRPCVRLQHDRPDNVIEWLRRGEIEAVTIPYNAAKRHFRPVVDFCGENDIGCFTMQSTHGGFLAATKGRLGELFKEKADNPALAAQRWLLAHKGITAPLIGFEAVDQVESSSTIAHEVDDLEAAGPEAVDYLKDFADMAENLCARCDYCAEACPEGIAPHTFLQQFQMWKILRDDGLLRSGVKRMKVAPDACTECESCEEARPSQLPIRELLKELVVEMKRLGIRAGES